MSKIERLTFTRKRLISDITRQNEVIRTFEKDTNAVILLSRKEVITLDVFFIKLLLNFIEFIKFFNQLFFHDQHIVCELAIKVYYFHHAIIISFTVIAFLFAIVFCCLCSIFSDIFVIFNIFDNDNIIRLWLDASQCSYLLKSANYHNGVDDEFIREYTFQNG